ncbi:helix-turn-helix domain-containing protein [Streptomyces sp. NPDC050264]|uniref:winged helix-turn-helix domain-containing protein n=1 Tax=Streptomyces sp. NPDC050264 TaxID=3155038 RepID=UPI0034260F11
MTEEDLTEEGPTEEAGETGRAARPLPDHPVRVALLDLLAELGTVTSSQAAARLGYSSGLCSFHLRRLARHGLIEEASHGGGRVRPWRLRWDDPRQSVRAVERSVEALVHLTPDEADQLALRIKGLLEPYERRRDHPAGAVPVSAVTLLRPLPSPGGAAT